MKCECIGCDKFSVLEYKTKYYSGKMLLCKKNVIRIIPEYALPKHKKDKIRMIKKMLSHDCVASEERKNGIAWIFRNPDRLREMHVRLVEKIDSHVVKKPVWCGD